MSLSINNSILATDFNNLKSQVIAICTTRSDQNEYNKNPITIPVINDMDKNTSQINATDFNLFLNKLYKFNNFPSTLNTIYTDDGSVTTSDIIYHLNDLSAQITALKNEPRQNNDDCKTGCMGLCTNSCNNACTGCTGTCSGTCTGGCSSCTGTCSGNCGGCGGCGNCGGCGGCSGNCAGSCKGGCNAGGSAGCTCAASCQGLYGAGSKTGGC